MPRKMLRIAWLGPVPGGDAGVTGVNAELLLGLATIGHRIDCFFPSAGHPLPQHLAEHENLRFIWGTSGWRWDRWYSRTKIAAFVSGLISRSISSVRLRHRIAARHREQPYDLIYQFSSIEAPAVPGRLRRSIPLVIHPETHAAGELRCLIAERALGRRCQPLYMLVAVGLVMLVRSLIQRLTIRHARVVVCISSVFRDHLIRDYGVPIDATVVVPNPVRIDRFAPPERGLGQPPTVLVLGRISARKGIEDVVTVARSLLDDAVDVRVRVVGGPSLWSDYTELLEDLPHENSEYLGPSSSSEVPQLLAGSDILLQASRYEPFALTVAEALAAGVPVVATTEVGAIENVSRAVVAEVRPGDVAAIAGSIVRLLEMLDQRPVELRRMARSEAERLFAPDIVCEQISLVLERLAA